MGTYQRPWILPWGGGYASRPLDPPLGPWVHIKNFGSSLGAVGTHQGPWILPWGRGYASRPLDPPLGPWVQIKAFGSSHQAVGTHQGLWIPPWGRGYTSRHLDPPLCLWVHIKALGSPLGAVGTHQGLWILPWGRGYISKTLDPPLGPWVRTHQGPWNFFLSNRPLHNVPWAIVGQVRCRVQISAKPRCAYGLQLTTAPPWFPVGVVVVRSLVFSTRLDPNAFCGISAEAAMGLPTMWGPTVLVAVSV